MSDYDLIIKNGEVFDGTGGPSHRLDIAIKDGKLIKIAQAIEGTATRTMDAAGKIVTPGFIDVHTHYDGQSTWDSHLNPSSNLGTTTVVMGNCGVGFAPCHKKDHEVLVQLMEGVEEIPGTVMNEGLPWNWETFPEYLTALEKKPRDIDIAALLPHGPLRVYVMGQRAIDREAATPEDIAAMKVLVAEAVDAGAVGLSTSRTLVHLSSTGDHIPTYEAATQELKQLGASLSGDKGNVFQFISDFDDPEDEFSILRETSEKTGAKGTFTLLVLDYTSDMWKQHLNRIEAAQRDGLDIRGQVLSRPVGMLMGHPATMSSFSKRPTFTALDDLPWDEKIERLKDPAIKAKILAEENIQPHVFIQYFNASYELMYPLEDPIEYLPEPDQSVEAIAKREGRDPADWLYDYFLGNNGANLVYIPAANYSEHIPELLQHPHTVTALGDGGAHVGSICDASANVYVLTKWVKDKQQIELSQAIHMLCRQGAELYSLLDRGLLQEGLKADLNIIDFDALKLHTPHIAYDLPAGGKRFLQSADGILATIKAGEVIYENGKATGALPGRLLRGKQADPRRTAQSGASI